MFPSRFYIGTGKDKNSDMKNQNHNRELLCQSDEKKIKTGEKLSLDQCKKILKRDGLNFTDEEVIIIRDFLYALATIDYLFYKEYLSKNHINQNQNNYEQNSDSLHQGEYRRAS